MDQLRAFLGDEEGAVSIEFTVLVPFFILLFVFFADAAVVYLTRTEMYNSARDIVRRMATEELTSMSDVVTYARDHLFLGQRTYSLSAQFGGDMTLSITVPIEQAAVFGYFMQPLFGRQLSVSVTMRREPLN